MSHSPVSEREGDLLGYLGALSSNLEGHLSHGGRSGNRDNLLFSNVAQS